MSDFIKIKFSYVKKNSLVFLIGCVKDLFNFIGWGFVLALAGWLDVTSNIICGSCVMFIHGNV